MYESNLSNMVPTLSVSSEVENLSEEVLAITQGFSSYSNTCAVSEQEILCSQSDEKKCKNDDNSVPSDIHGVFSEDLLKNRLSPSLKSYGIEESKPKSSVRFYLPSEDDFDCSPTATADKVRRKNNSSPNQLSPWSDFRPPSGGWDSDDLICNHEDFPFCDCLRKHAAAGAPHSPIRDIGDLSSLINPGIHLGPKIEDDVSTTSPQSIATSIVREPPLPGAEGGRRASIITCNTRRSDIATEEEPIRIAVFGKDGVGKSALIVRLVTGRFIGEYDPSMEAVYSYTLPFADQQILMQVMDTAGMLSEEEEGREHQVSWGEAFILVFSLTSQESLTALHHIRRRINDLTPGGPRPLVLVGNKADLKQSREISAKQILELADLWACDYFEVSAAEPWDVVVRPFAAICQSAIERRAS